MTIQYKETLRSYVAYRTRFKENLSKSVPGKIETTTGKSIMITLDGEQGKTSFQVYLYSNVDDSVVITDAARRIRKVQFLDIQTFDEIFHETATIWCVWFLKVEQ